MATASSPCRYDLNTVNGKSLTPLYNYTKQTEGGSEDVDALLIPIDCERSNGFIKITHILLYVMISRC